MPLLYANSDLDLNCKNCSSCTSNVNELNPVECGGKISEPEVAKFAPWLKLAPTESRYARRKGNPRLSAEIPDCSCQQILVKFSKYDL